VLSPFELVASIFELHLLLYLHAGICGCPICIFSVNSNDMLKDSNARVSKTVLVKLGCGLSSGVIAVFGRIGEHCLCLPCFR
jgi:hypothetical protein